MQRSIFRNTSTQSDVLRYIVENGFQPGEQLPTIQHISKELNVSVAKVREDLEVARSMGLVDVKPGRGMRVQEYRFGPSMTLSSLYAIGLDTNNFLHLGQMRNALEVYFWDEAVSQLTPKDIVELRRLIGVAMSKLGREPIQVPAAEHRLFHMIFFKRLENPFVQGVLEAFWEVYEAFGLNLYMELAYHRTVWNYHAQIVDALEAGDIEGGRKLLVDHMNLLGDRRNNNGGMPG